MQQCSAARKGRRKIEGSKGLLAVSSMDRSGRSFELLLLLEARAKDEDSDGSVRGRLCD